MSDRAWRDGVRQYNCGFVVKKWLMSLNAIKKLRNFKD